jgi:hypothetical protein
VTTPAQGRKIVGVTATLATRVARKPTQDARNWETPVNAAATITVSLIPTAQVQDAKAKAVAALASVTAAATLATQTVPDPTWDAGTAGVVLDTSASAARTPATLAKGAGAQVQAETEEEVTTRMAAEGKGIGRTKEAAMVYLLRGAAGHPTGKTSGNINQKMLNLARCCKA